MTLKAQQGSWDYEEINAMITNPNAFAPGTKMALFPGLPEAKQRADVIAFLRTKNDNPPPLPEAPAGGGAAPVAAPAASPEGNATPAAPKAEEPAPSAETPPAPAAEEKKPAESAPAPATPGEQPSSPAPQETPQQ